MSDSNTKPIERTKSIDEYQISQRLQLIMMKFFSPSMRVSVHAIQSHSNLFDLFYIDVFVLASIWHIRYIFIFIIQIRRLLTLSWSTVTRYWWHTRVEFDEQHKSVTTPNALVMCSICQLMWLRYIVRIVLMCIIRNYSSSLPKLTNTDRYQNDHKNMKKSIYEIFSMFSLSLITIFVFDWFRQFVVSLDLH